MADTEYNNPYHLITATIHYTTIKHCPYKLERRDEDTKQRKDYLRILISPTNNPKPPTISIYRCPTYTLPLRNSYVTAAQRQPYCCPAVNNFDRANL